MHRVYESPFVPNQKSTRILLDSVDFNILPETPFSSYTRCKILTIGTRLRDFSNVCVTVTSFLFVFAEVGLHRLQDHFWWRKSNDFSEANVLDGNIHKSQEHFTYECLVPVE